MAILYCILLLLRLFCVGTAQEILSTGEYRNSEFTWATNITSLQFSFEYDCLSSCQITWRLDGARLGFAELARCFNDNALVATLMCDVNGTKIFSEVTILGQFSSTGVKKLEVAVSTGLDRTRDLTIKDCNSSSPGSTGNNGNVNSTGLISTTFENNIPASCKDGFESDSPLNLTCEFDSSWSPVECSATQTEGGNKTGATDRMSEGDIAGTVLTCIFILECICLCVFVFALNYDLSLKLIIGLYVAGICLSIIGIFMSFFGSSTAGTVMNSVEIAGTVLGSVGITVMLGGIVMQALKGVGSKDYAAGEPPK